MTIVKPAEGQVVTKLSQLDPSPLEYHIRNIHNKVAQPREECDDILALLGELDAEGMAKPAGFSDAKFIKNTDKTAARPVSAFEAEGRDRVQFPGPFCGE